MSERFIDEIAADLRSLAGDVERSTDGRAIVCITLDIPAETQGRQELAATIRAVADEMQAP